MPYSDILFLQQHPQEPEPTDSPEPAQSPEAQPQPQRRRVTPPSSPEASEQEDRTDANFGGAANGTSNSNHDQAVKKIVRLALACEYQRRPIRRTDIGGKVLGKDGGRTFKTVFTAAQQQLRQVFGMELMELPAREKVTLQQKRAAQKSQGGNKAVASWVLTSILPPQFRVAEILSPATAGAEGSEGTYTALYTVLVALIMLGGGQIAQAKMERYLRRLGLEDRTPVYGSEKTEKLLKRLEKEGYIQEIREKAVQGEEDVSYIVGPRGKVEVGHRGVEGLVKTVYGEVEGADEEELERRIARSLGVSEGPPKAAQNGDGRKKRGRPRRDDGDPEDHEQSGDEEDEEGNELYE